MQQADKTRFVKAFAVLTEVFNEQVSDLRIEAYYGVLAEFSIESVEQGIKTAMQTCRFFPKPAELIEFMQGSSVDRAEQAWQIAWDAYKQAGYYQSVLFEDGAIARTIQIVFGGWVQFSEASRQLSPEMFQARKKDFLSTYKREARHAREPQRLAGHFEIENLNTVATWTKDRFSETYTQRIFIAQESGGRFVEATYSRSDARLIETNLQLLIAAQTVELPAKPGAKFLPPMPEPSKEARQMKPEEIRVGIRALIESVKT